MAVINSAWRPPISRRIALHMTKGNKNSGFVGFQNRRLAFPDIYRRERTPAQLRFFLFAAGQVIHQK